MTARNVAGAAVATESVLRLATQGRVVRLPTVALSRVPARSVTSRFHSSTCFVFTLNHTTRCRAPWRLPSDPDPYGPQRL